MIINSVKIRNIRSYEDAIIEFPEGTTLLSGDIGSGKSTILLAVEFALFGIMRGELAGSQLLRHGQSQGSVELNLTLEGKKSIIYRALKKSKDAVTQDAGYIVVDDEKFEGTPVELKSKILEMIGYPDDLVSKSKSMLYRYTVYTPQESMKHILLEGDEARLDTLRRLFNIDKYKRIKENAAIFARELRSQAKLLQSKLEGVVDLEKSLSEKSERKVELEKQLKSLVLNLENESKKLVEAKGKVESIEAKAEVYRKAEQNLELARNSLKEKSERILDSEGELKEISSLILILEKELDGKSPDMLSKVEDAIKKVQDAISKANIKLSTVKEEEAVLNSKNMNAKKLKKDISELDNCPVCLQEVDVSHTKKVCDDQNNLLASNNDRLEQIKSMKNQIDVKLKEYDAKFLAYRNKEKELSSLSQKFASLNEKKARKDKLSSSIKELKDAIIKPTQEIAANEKILSETKNISKEVEDAKLKYEGVRENAKILEISKASLSKDAEAVEESLQDLNKRMKDFEKDKKMLTKINENVQWISEYFVKVIDVMEKKVMLRIYGEFNEYFVEWFNTLMEDETISVRLDEKFSPVIIQDGYETSVDNLSGGEKTSVALAYRLALNKVINDFISTIKTKGIIILDEPTDGFSSEQLDRVREVLKQLNVLQTIIVSHEPKMESYVENVIRVTKNNHVSKVV
uniref:SMC domain-containing protein (SbcC) n=1 Tax=uncultured marine group II/III euryarchaeote KM3_83_G03 TaxID=1456522 RepID=A0A075HT53_9EURY|nr:SMC domain-containing protein (sbcC) [uncultured marine group II/III euryarchaeote KM3_83_G03]